MYNFQKILYLSSQRAPALVVSAVYAVSRRTYAQSTVKTDLDAIPFDETFTEVRYGETDQMGYAHHATAVLWFELGRVAWLRSRGLSYRQLELDGVLLPVVELNLHYHAPGRFEDALAVRTRLVELGKTRVKFE